MTSPVCPRPVLLALALLALVPSAAPADPITVSATPVPFDDQDAGHRFTGDLEFRGGLRLTSPDPRFGGISSIRVLEGDRIVAVTDEGCWLTARLVLEDGMLMGVVDAEMGPLLGEDGRPLEGKETRDSEALAALPDGSFVVAFERQHRLLSYPAGTGRPDGVPTRVPPPPGLEDAPYNTGIETLVSLGDGRLLAILEQGGSRFAVPGWVGRPGAWESLGLVVEGHLRPSDGAASPGRGDVLILERAYDAARGVLSVRIRRIATKKLKPGAMLSGAVLAELKPPVTLDNYEGLAAWAAGDETRLLLVSDDNFNAVAGQRTLLMMFRRRGKSR